MRTTRIMANLRVADVEAAKSFYTGQERGGLVQGQALARPPRLPFRGISQGGDVTADQIAAFGVADRAGQCVVAHRHRGGRVAGRHRGEGLADVVGSQPAGRGGVAPVLQLRR